MSDAGGNIYRLPTRRAPDRPAITPFRPFYASEMEGRTIRPREWIVDGVLQRRSVMLFAGPAKIGKSLLMQQALTACAVGEPFLDRMTIPTKSFGLFCEDPQDEMERRQEQLNNFYNRAPADYELGFSWLSLEGKEAVLVEFDRYGVKPKFTPLFYQLREFVLSERIELVALDNARVVFGGSEISPQQVTAFVRVLVAWALEFNGGIILAAHPAKNDPRGFSGTTAWLASVRSGMSLHRPKDYDEETHTWRDPRRVLAGFGANYGAGLGVEHLVIRDGVFTQTEQERERNKKPGPLSDAEMLDLRYRLLTGLRRVLGNGGKVPADEEHKDSMPHRARRSPDPQINRVPLNDLYRAQELLIEAGQVTRVSVQRRVLIRPTDGPLYEGEEPWLPTGADKIWQAKGGS